MSLACTSKTLHVLRLVLEQSEQHAHPFASRPASAFIRNFAACRSLRSEAAAIPCAGEVFHAKDLESAQDGPVNFLESPSAEYHQTSQLLPLRSLAPEPIPWPTLFPTPHSQESAGSSRPHRCDAVARLVAEGNLAAARTLVEELRSLHVGVLHRVVYIQAALQSLDHTEAGREAFFFWLDLVPNRPAVRAYPALNDPWLPLVHRLIQHHTMDADLIEQVTLFAAKKGVLPSVASPLGRHLAYVVPFDRAMDVMRSSLRLYYDAVTPADSTSERAQIHEQHAADRVRDTWKAYQYILSRTHRDTDRTVFASPLEGVGDMLQAEDPTRNLLEEEAMAAASSSTSGFGAFGENGRTDPVHLRRRAAEALEGKVSVRELASILFLLERYGHAAYLGLLERRFIAQSAEHPHRADMYWHTRIYMLVQERRNEEAIALFQQHFHWLGMPDHPLRSSAAAAAPAASGASPSSQGLFGSDALETVKIYPSSGTLTTLLPALLHTLPNGQLVPFHQTYLDLAGHLPDSIRLNPVGFDDFLRHIIRRMHPKQSIKAYYHAMAAGRAPQVAAWNRFLQVAARRKLDRIVKDIVRAMETGSPYASFGLPKPDVETYTTLAETLKRYPEYQREVQQYYRKAEALKRNEAIFKAQRLEYSEAGRTVLA